MKRFLKYTFVLLALPVLFTACEDFLDKSPDLGLSEDDIYKNYNSIRGYLDKCYPMLERWNVASMQQKSRCMNPMAITDELASSVNENNFVANKFTTGNWYSVTRNGDWEVGVNDDSIIRRSYKAIRIANRVINNIDKVADITAEEKNLVLGQAYFYRSWFYYQLINRYGGMPILDRVFDAGEDDIPRKTYKESYEWMISDIEQAVALLPDMWDDQNYSRPDKAAALGFKAQAMLYAASPLMQNDLNSTVEKDYDKTLCLSAAKAAQECLDFVERHPESGRKFTKGESEATKMDAYRGIFIIPNNTFCHEEYLWWDRRQETSEERANTLRRYWIWADLDSFTGQDAACFGMPTANIVAYYERKGPDGNYYPITDSRSGYVEGTWESTKDRDPRFYNNLLLPGQRWGTTKDGEYYITSWKGGAGYKKFYNTAFLSSQRQFTGWMSCKYTWPECTNKAPAGTTNGFDLYRNKSFYIRVTEMYLDYAEALFEATGSATTKPDGYRWTPEEAINIVRSRVGVTPVVADYTTPATFRETYRRERTVELMFENHRWEDIRRWMLFDELFSKANPIQNYEWTCEQKNPKPAQGNLTFTYEIVDNTVEVRNYDSKHYWYPFPGAEVGSLSNLQQNPGW